MFRAYLGLSLSDRAMALGTLGFLLVFSLACKLTDNNFWKSTLSSNNVNAFGDELSYNLIFVTLGIVDIWLGEIIKRVFVFCGELRFINSRYDGRILFVVQQSFCTKSNIPFLTLPILVAMLTYMNLHGDGMLLVWRILQTKWNCIIIVTTSMIAHLLRLTVSKCYIANKILFVLVCITLSHSN